MKERNNLLSYSYQYLRSKNYAENISYARLSRYFEGLLSSILEISRDYIIFFFC